MAMTPFALNVLLALALAPETVLLTPDNVAEYGYHVRCVPVDQSKKEEAQATRPTGPVLVHLRFGRLPGTSGDDLLPIKAVTLVVRDGNDVQLSVPLHAEVDFGNRVHLYSRFSTQKALLEKMQLVFDEEREQGSRTFVVNLKAFIGQRGND